MDARDTLEQLIGDLDGFLEVVGTRPWCMVDPGVTVGVLGLRTLRDRLVGCARRGLLPDGGDVGLLRVWFARTVAALADARRVEPHRWN